MNPKWSRVENVEMKGMILLFRTSDGQMAVPHLETRPVTLRLNAASLLWDRKSLSALARQVVVSRRNWGFDALEDGHLVLVVHSEKQRSGLAMGVQTLDHATRALISIELKP